MVTEELKADIDSKTGRDLDMLVALLIDGWKWVRVPPDANRKNGCEILTPSGELPVDFELPRLGSIHPAYMVPAYSSRLDLAIRLCQRCAMDRIEISGNIYNLPERLVRECLMQHL